MVSEKILRPWKGKVWFDYLEKVGVNPHVQKGHKKSINFVTNELLLLRCLYEKLGIEDKEINAETVQQVEDYLMGPSAYDALAVLFSVKWIGGDTEDFSREDYKLVFGGMTYGLKQEFGIQVPGWEEPTT